MLLPASEETEEAETRHKACQRGDDREKDQEHHYWRSQARPSEREIPMMPAQELILFVLNIIGIVIALLFMLVLWVWPALRRQPFAVAVVPLLVFHMFRAIGGGFLIPGVVSPELPSEFTTLAATGDLIAAGLAAIAALAVVRRWSWAKPAVWLFNIFGLLDLLNAFFQVGRLGILPGQMQTMYLIVTIYGPALLLTHGVIFALLLRQPRTVEVPKPPRGEAVAYPG
jgi:hypothetical protein